MEDKNYNWMGLMQCYLQYSFDLCLGQLKKKKKPTSVSCGANLAAAEFPSEKVWPTAL